MMSDELLGRVSAVRFRLLILISMLDYTPLHDVGQSVMELGAVMMTGGELPGFPDDIDDRPTQAGGPPARDS